MDIKYPIEIEYIKCVLQINGLSGPCPRVRSSHRIGSIREHDTDRRSILEKISAPFN